MITTVLPLRGTDDFGSGEFQAPRGSRNHKGIDYACYPNTAIRSTVEGKVTKLGYPYADDMSFRYVEITDNQKAKHRFFYVNPVVDIGDIVTPDWSIGTSQNIAGRYKTDKKTMRNHIHYEILVDNKPVNPEEYVL